MNLATRRMRISRAMSIYKNTQSKVKIIADFRSDTVTRPSVEMLSRLLHVVTGDDVFEEDETVNELQSRVAAISGKEDALFCMSGTMSNQLAIRTHLLQPPYSVLCDYRSHVYTYEAGGISFHTGATVIPVRPSILTGHLTLEDIEAEAILDDDVHHCPTRLICLENTLNGEVYSLQEQTRISRFAGKNGIKLHLDGARLWNSSIATGDTIKKLCDPFDSVSLCFSKGLGAPIGSVLVGKNEAYKGTKKFIKKARHFRKLFGGGWRQAGILASACLYALDEILPILHVDHENALILSQGLQAIGFEETRRCDTNMVWVDTSNFGLNAQDLCDVLLKDGIAIFGGTGFESRFVLHHQISKESVLKTIDILGDLVRRSK